MIRNLLATTAVVALMSGVAAAQNTTPAQPNGAGAPPANAQQDSIKNQDSMIKGSAGAQSQAGFSASPQAFQSGDLLLASNLTGSAVYENKGTDAQKIGDINDLIIAEGGDIENAILGVGGFLGLGQKNVAVKFSQIEKSKDADGDMRLTLAMSKDELKAMPSYVDPNERSAGATTPNANNNAAANRPNAGSPRDAMGRADDSARTPAGGTAANTGAGANTGSGRASATMTKVTRVSAEQLIGAKVQGTANEDVGEVNDVVLSKDGKVQALIVDVGGFLGMGEKPVALTYGQFQIARAGNSSDLTLTAAMTKQSLESMPNFDKSEMSGAKRDTGPSGAARTPGASGPTPGGGRAQ